MILKSLEKMLRDSNKENIDNYGIIKAYDGIEGLALFKIDYLLNKSIKLVITDQNMNMMNGFEMLNIMKKYSISENNPKLCLSSSDDSDLKTQSIGKKFYFLSKPINKSELNKLLV